MSEPKNRNKNRERVVRPVRYQTRWPWWRKAVYYAAKPFRFQPEMVEDPDVEAMDL